MSVTCGVYPEEIEKHCKAFTELPSGEHPGNLAPFEARTGICEMIEK